MKLSITSITMEFSASNVCKISLRGRRYVVNNIGTEPRGTPHFNFVKFSFYLAMYWARSFKYDSNQIWTEASFHFPECKTANSRSLSIESHPVPPWCHCEHELDRAQRKFTNLCHMNGWNASVSGNLDNNAALLVAVWVLKMSLKNLHVNTSLPQKRLKKIAIVFKTFGKIPVEKHWFVITITLGAKTSNWEWNFR